MAQRSEFNENSLPRVLISESAEQTEAVGRALAQAVRSDASLPPFVALYGDLGVGKTAFVRGFTSEFAPEAKVKSPTFALVNEYRGKERSVFHFDLYRIDGEDDLYSIGFYDYLDRRGVCLTEWSENIEFALPDRYLKVLIEKLPDGHTDRRRITVDAILS